MYHREKSGSFRSTSSFDFAARFPDLNSVEYSMLVLTISKQQFVFETPLNHGVYMYLLKGSGTLVPIERHSGIAVMISPTASANRKVTGKPSA